MEKVIKRALISVYHKDGIEAIVRKLVSLGVEIVSTGGTYDYIVGLGLPCEKVEDFTQYPSMLHGRVKTLHPAIFGGILAQRENASDCTEVAMYNIKPIDLVLVDLYPFEETVQNTNNEAEIIEKIDIGGISLIRAAAKNYKDVVIVASKQYYASLQTILDEQGAVTTIGQRKSFARAAFAVSSAYDSAIFSYFDEDELSSLRIAVDGSNVLRYGENPHQRGFFFGDLEKYFDKLQGKELSFNNLQDIAAAVDLIAEFPNEPTFAVLKHTNPCGLATGETICQAWQAAYQADTESVFGGILIANRSIDKQTAEAIGNMFFEVLIAPDFDTDSLPILTQKSKRILLVEKQHPNQQFAVRSALGGFLVQDSDNKTETYNDCNVVTERKPSNEEVSDALFAQRIVKHCKSNAIVIVKNKQLLASGIGQTSRVAALKQAIEKAKRFGFDLNGAVVASDAFFPFADCVELAANEGIVTFIQPGGSIRDNDSIDLANKRACSMLFTGVRHFKH